MTKFLFHSITVIGLTVLSQVGGLAWVLALAARRRIVAFVILYGTLSAACLWIAPYFGRTPIPCLSSEGAARMQSPLYCALNRQYVVPELADLIADVSSDMQKQFEGTITLVLDAGFPFVDGFPLLPHLSHDDGRKVDFAFYYKDATGYAPGRTRSPLGYFAFEAGPTSCPKTFPSLRWDLEPLQGLWADLELEATRTKALVERLVSDPRVGKIFLEPHLVETLGVDGAKVRFQGCRAARHDDHIHVQL